MWEIVPWALTTMNSGGLCTCPHCVMTMLQRGGDNVGSCAIGIDNDDSCCWCPCPHCVMTMRQRGDCNVGNCVSDIDSDELMLCVSIPTLCDYNAATG